MVVVVTRVVTTIRDQSLAIYSYLLISQVLSEFACNIFSIYLFWRHFIYTFFVFPKNSPCLCPQTHVMHLIAFYIN